MNEIGARTKVVGVLGHPVGHSVSPAMQNAAFAALGMDWRYLAFDVSPERLSDALRGARALGMVGLNLTIPHKEAALAVAEDIEPSAHRIRAVNTICLKNGHISAYNTDKQGALLSLAEAGFAVKDRRVLVLGAGGAARAVVVGLAEQKVKAITVVARRTERAEELAALAADIGVEGRAAAWGEGLRELVAQADLVVNASPIGMSPQTGETPLPSEWLEARHFVYDLVFNPDPTRLVAEARQRGCRALGGLEMLVQQGALSFELWTGVKPPIGVMRESARAALKKG